MKYRAARHKTSSLPCPSPQPRPPSRSPSSYSLSSTRMAFRVPAADRACWLHRFSSSSSPKNVHCIQMLPPSLPGLPCPSIPIRWCVPPAISWPPSPGGASAKGQHGGWQGVEVRVSSLRVGWEQSSKEEIIKGELLKESCQKASGQWRVRNSWSSLHSRRRKSVCD
jgi:hypothetical protein